MKAIRLTCLLILVLASCNSAPTATVTAPVVDEAVPTVANDAIEPTAISAEPAPTEAPATLPTEEPQPEPTPPPTNEPDPTETPVPTAEPTVPAEVIIEVDGAELPPGFSMIKYTDSSRPVALTFDEDGYLFTTHQNGDIIVYKDTDGDGRADFESQYSFGFDWPNGIAIHPENGDTYVSQKGKISILRDLDGDYIADEAENFANGLPFNLHWSNELVFGPDGMLYMGLGSTCDVCVEVDERSATIMRFDTTTGDSEIVASGLRNPFDVAFHPETGALFATDNGRDDLGEGQPLEELNHIVAGSNYGWPDCYGEMEGSNCGGTKQAIGFFQGHSSTNSLQFYTETNFPEEYRGDLFASVFGSWFFPQGIQRGIQRIELAQDGGTYSTDIDWFLKWDAFLLGLTMGPDGALYVGDYNVENPDGGGIYRISYGLP